ncbi:MAG TPA: SGNH/GDSL hydrolase family protein, partial [Gemmataceae bacterium]|nr:SGNH/GDSL hydrolase family protein [Gemmataceae bacterium]
MKLLSLPLFVLILVPTLRAAEVFTLRDGDRVVLIGSTLIEREQRYGYWETALTRRYPNKSITFRNLGWSGDTVYGDARVGFGTQADGFRHLKDHVLALKPTVIIIGYGTNESFEGRQGLPRFIKGLETLLDAFAPTKARIVLLSPLKQEKLGPPLPDPKENNKNLRLYADAIRDVAQKRGHFFVDFYQLLDKEMQRLTDNDLPMILDRDGKSRRLKKQSLTDNGIHLTTYGYWRSAAVLERALGFPDDKWLIELSAKGKVEKAKGAKVTKIATDPLRFRLTADILPLALPPADGWLDIIWELHSLRNNPVLKVKGLPTGTYYTLRIDGDYKASGVFWAIGSEFQPPDTMQASRLREAIVAKNRLYFYRWRPENETY